MGGPLGGPPSHLNREERAHDRDCKALLHFGGRLLDGFGDLERLEEKDGQPW